MTQPATNPVGEQQASHSVGVVQELDLGQHTLFIRSDSSIDLLANDEQTPYLADNMLGLDGEEAWHLYIALHEHFKQAGEKGDMDAAS